MNKRVLVTLLSFLIIAGGTFVAIRYAQGYRPSRQGVLKETGLLSANSFPTGASVYINGNLTSATDTTLNLAPGTYAIEITKDGFWSWKKDVTIARELVTQTNALLIPQSPSLTPLTFTGANRVTPSPDGQKLLFYVASASAARNNGLYVLELSDNPLALQRGARQIARQTAGWNFENTTFLWSPDSNRILLSEENKNVIIEASRTTELETARDVTVGLRQTLAEWEEEVRLRRSQLMRRFPPEVIAIASQSATHVFLSPDERMLMYTATASATLPNTLIQSPPSSSTQTQSRSIEAGKTYVYDRQEDRNFFIASGMLPTPAPSASPTPIARGTRNSATPSPAIIPAQVPPTSAPLQDWIAWFKDQYSAVYGSGPQWLPDSRHLILRKENSISIIEYDGTNEMQVFSGAFEKNFVYPWPNGNKLIIKTNFNQTENVPFNLYAVSLR